MEENESMSAIFIRFALTIIGIIGWGIWGAVLGAIGGGSIMVIFIGVFGMIGVMFHSGSEPISFLIIAIIYMAVGNGIIGAIGGGIVGMIAGMIYGLVYGTIGDQVHP